MITLNFFALCIYIKYNISWDQHSLKPTLCLSISLQLTFGARWHKHKTYVSLQSLCFLGRKVLIGLWIPDSNPRYFIVFYCRDISYTILLFMRIKAAMYLCSQTLTFERELLIIFKSKKYNFQKTCWFCILCAVPECLPLHLSFSMSLPYHWEIKVMTNSQTLEDTVDSQQTALFFLGQHEFWTREMYQAEFLMQIQLWETC